METGNKLGLTLTLFIAVLIGIVLLGTTADEVTKVTTGSNSANDTLTFTGTSNQTTTANDELIAFATLQNASGYAHLVGTDYNVTTATGLVTIAGNLTADGTGTFYAAYTYTPDDYVADGTARTLIELIIIFFALAIFAIGAGYAIKLFKDVM